MKKQKRSRKVGSGPESEPWGPSLVAKQAKPFGESQFHDGTKFDLIHDKYPHTRRDDNVYARMRDGGDVIAFNGHRIITSISIESFNYMKSSGLSGDEVRKGGEAKISFNGRLVYGFTFRDPQLALIEAHRLITVLYEHPVDWQQPNFRDLIGRSIYYHDTPAVITTYYPEQGNVIIEAVNKKKGFPLPVYRANGSGEEGQLTPDIEFRIKDDLLSPHIWWFRK